MGVISVLPLCLTQGAGVSEKGACIRIWGPGFCGFYLEDTSLDSLDSVASRTVCSQIQQDGNKQ